MLQIRFSQKALRKLIGQDPKTENRGGFQKLVIGLRRQVDSEMGILGVSDSQIEKIERYRKQYGRGGWQDILDEVLKQAQKS